MGSLGDDAREGYSTEALYEQLRKWEIMRHRVMAKKGL